MKNLSFYMLLICSMVSYDAFSQKQVQGDKSIEVQFAPIGSEPVKISGIRGRYFLSQETTKNLFKNGAIRLSAFAGGTKNTIVGDTTGGAAETKDVTSNFDFTLRPGFERHLTGNDKLSPYFGLEALLGIKSTKSIDESVWAGNTSNVAKTKVKTTSPVVGLNFIAGTDYYFANQLYIGLEIGFGLNSEGKGKTKTTYTNQEFPDLFDNSVVKGNSKEFNWGPTYQGTLRLGWLF